MDLSVQDEGVQAWVQALHGIRTVDEAQPKYSHHHILSTLAHAPDGLWTTLTNFSTQDTHAGCTLQIEYKPKVPASEFPVLDTRPITSTVSAHVFLERTLSDWCWRF